MEKTGIIAISIVAVVALIGVTAMFLSGPTAAGFEASAITGEASKYSKYANEPIASIDVCAEGMKCGFFSEIKVVEDIMKERKGYGDYTLYRSNIGCPRGWKIVSAFCNPQNSHDLFQTLAYLDAARNEFSCEYISRTVGDAVIKSTAICIR